jgi:hypothetical protein
MDKDWIERDRLLTELHSNSQHIKELLDKQTASFDIHIINDSLEFKVIKKRIFYLTMAMVIVAVVIGGPNLAFKLLGK